MNIESRSFESEARLTSTEDMLNQAQIEAYLRDLTELLQEIDGLDNRYSELFPHLDQLGEDQRSLLINKLEEDASLEIPRELDLIFLQMLAFSQEVNRLYTQLQDIRLALEPYENLQFRESLLDLAVRMDYAAVGQYISKNPGEARQIQNTLSLLSQMELFVSANQQVDYERVKTYQDQLTKMKPYFQDLDLLSVDCLRDGINLDIVDAKLVETTVVNLDTALAEYQEYEAYARDYCFLTDKPVYNRWDLHNLQSFIQAYNHSSHIHPELFAVLQERAQNLLQALRVYGMLPTNPESRQLSQQRVDALPTIDKLVTMVEIKGFEPGLVISTADIQYILQQYPGPIIAKLNSIEYCPEPESESVGEGGVIAADVGQLADMIYYLSLEPQADSPVHRLNLLIGNNFRETVAHELGHLAHNVLTLDEIRVWEEIMQQYPLDLTWNVQHSRAAADRNPKREDFADTFKFFFQNPALLQRLSVQRYEFMRQFILDRVPTDQKLNYQNKWRPYFSYYSQLYSQYSDEELRRMYLSHLYEE